MLKYRILSWNDVLVWHRQAILLIRLWIFETWLYSALQWSPIVSCTTWPGVNCPHLARDGVWVISSNWKPIPWLQSLGFFFFFTGTGGGYYLPMNPQRFSECFKMSTHEQEFLLLGTLFVFEDWVGEDSLISANTYVAITLSVFKDGHLCVSPRQFAVKCS